MLRQAVAEKTVLGQRVENIINQGRLVPDDLIVSVIEERISRKDCGEGFILDGFPRTIEQGEALERVLPGGVDKIKGDYERYSVKVVNEMIQASNKLSECIKCKFL